MEPHVGSNYDGSNNGKTFKETSKVACKPQQIIRLPDGDECILTYIELIAGVLVLFGKVLPSAGMDATPNKACDLIVLVLSILDPTALILNNVSSQLCVNPVWIS